MIKPRINVEVDPDLKRKAQLKAFKEKKTLTEVIIQLIKDWVKKGAQK